MTVLDGEGDTVTNAVQKNTQERSAAVAAGGPTGKSQLFLTNCTHRMDRLLARSDRHWRGLLATKTPQSTTRSLRCDHQTVHSGFRADQCNCRRMHQSKNTRRLANPTLTIRCERSSGWTARSDHGPHTFHQVVVANFHLSMATRSRDGKHGLQQPTLSNQLHNLSGLNDPPLLPSSQPC